MIKIIFTVFVVCTIIQTLTKLYDFRSVESRLETCKKQLKQVEKLLDDPEHDKKWKRYLIVVAILCGILDSFLIYMLFIL